MKNKFLVCILIFICVFGMTGCVNKEEKEAQIYEYTHIDTMFGHIVNLEHPLGDWGYGSENKNAYKDKFNVDAPIFSIHVNPLATDELYDMYVENLKVIDDYMAQNGEYLKYIKKNHPYYVSFDCLDEDVLVVEINGKVDAESVKKELKEIVAPIKEETEEKLLDFDSYMKTRNDIQIDQDGEYYYVIDSKNVSESINPVMDSLDEINVKFPFSQEVISKMNDSYNYIGVLGGGFEIYFDEYGNDPLSEDYKLGFATSSAILYNLVYSHFVTQGTIEENSSLRTFYYCNMLKDEVKVFGGYYCSSSMTKEEVKEVLWIIYDMVMSEHEEHGIKAIADYSLDGTCLLTDDPNGMSYETKLVIPKSEFDERISKERFYEMVEESSRVFDASEYILPDDCF